jgi:hypothetical protein
VVELVALPCVGFLYVQVQKKKQNEKEREKCWEMANYLIKGRYIEYFRYIVHDPIFVKSAFTCQWNAACMHDIKRGTVS